MHFPTCLPARLTSRRVQTCLLRLDRTPLASLSGRAGGGGGTDRKQAEHSSVGNLAVFGDSSKRACVEERGEDTLIAIADILKRQETCT